MTYAVEKCKRREDYGIVISGGPAPVSKTRCKSNRNEKKENSCRTVGRCSLKCSKLDAGKLDAAQCSFLSCRQELTTSAHDDALKHLKHDAIEARGTGPAGIWRSGGSITAESFYNMEPRKAPETWRCGLGEYVGPSVEDI
jgi:hypothetical protein